LVIATAALVAWIRLLPLSPGVLDDYAALQVYGTARTIAHSLPANLPAAERRAALQRRVAQWREGHREEFDAERQKIAARLRSEVSYKGADGARRIILGD
jgi:hypothetical protein